MRVGSDRTKKATAQLLEQEYANLKFKDGETVEDFSLRLQTLISKLKSVVLATTEWRGRATEPDGGRHGPIHDEGQRHAGKVLG